MIVVDSSAWIDAHRRRAGKVAAALARLLDADEVALALLVRLELLAGVARRDRAALERALAALPVLRPTDETWHLVETWVPRAADAVWRLVALERLKFVALYARFSGGEHYLAVIRTPSPVISVLRPDHRHTVGRQRSVVAHHSGVFGQRLCHQHSVEGGRMVSGQGDQPLGVRPRHGQLGEVIGRKKRTKGRSASGGPAPS